jgi:hypothetical protein
VDQTSSYWAIIIPLWFAIDMVNDSFTRQAQEHVNHVMTKLADEKQFDEAKASGTLPEKLCAFFMAHLNSGDERGRIEESPPSGYSDLKPRMWYEDSGDSNIATGVLEFVLPGVTPGQAYTFKNRYTPEEKGLGTDKTVQVSRETVWRSKPGERAQRSPSATEAGKRWGGGGGDGGSPPCNRLARS